MKEKIIKAIIASLLLNMAHSEAHRLHSHSHMKGYAAPVKALDADQKIFQTLATEIDQAEKNTGQGVLGR